MYKQCVIVLFISCRLCASGRDVEQSTPFLCAPPRVAMSATKPLAERARALNHGESLTVIAAPDMYGENNFRARSVIKLDHSKQEKSHSRGCWEWLAVKLAACCR
jgi:hypothetical protein